MNDNKRKLYDTLSKDYDMGTFEQFTSDIEDDAKRKKLYDEVSKEYDMGDYYSFSDQLGFKRSRITVPEPPAQNKVSAANASMKPAKAQTPQEETAPAVRGRITVPEADMQGSQPTVSLEEKAAQPASGEQQRRALEKSTREQVAALRAQVDSDLDTAVGESMQAYRNEEEEANKGGFFRQMAYSLAHNVGHDPAAVAARENYRQTKGGGNPELSGRIAALQSAKNSLTNAQRIIDEADRNDKDGNYNAWQRSFFGGAARGMGQHLFDPRTWDMGESDVSDTTALLAALDKYDKGEELTKSEQAMLDAKAVELATNAYFGSYVGRGYKAGSVTAESIPFMLEMCINPAASTGKAATSKLTRYALERYGKKVVKDNAKKYAAAKIATRVGADMVGSAAMAATSGAMGVAADAESRMAGLTGDSFSTDGEGYSFFNGIREGEDAATALAKAFGSRTIENHSEMVGEYFAPVLGVLGKGLSKGLDKIGLGKVNKFIADINATDAAKLVKDFEEHAKWNGLIGEFAEEIVGGVENALVVGDQTLDANPDTGVFNPSQMLDTFLGVSLMGGFMSSAKTLGYVGHKASAAHNLNKADTMAQTVFGDEEWKDISAEIRSGVDDNDLTQIEERTATEKVPARKKAMLDYMKAYAWKKGVDTGTMKRRTEGVVGPAQFEAETSYENGYELTEPQEKEDAQRRYEYCKQQLKDRLGKEDITLEEAFSMQDLPLSDEEKRVALDYLNAKATYEGMIQHVRDDIDGKVTAAHASIDANTNVDTGRIQPAVMKTGDKKVYVVGGHVAMLEDGTGIDKDNSDDSVIVRDAETGALEMVSPSDIFTLDADLDPEEEKKAVQTRISESVAREEADRIDGKVQFTAGQQVVLPDAEGNAVTYQIVEDPATGVVADYENGVVNAIVVGGPEDGKQQAIVQIPIEPIQAQHDAEENARLQQYEQERMKERIAIAQTEQQAQESERAYQPEDEVSLRNADGTVVRGSIVSGPNEDGQYEVYTEEPFNGKKVSYLTKEDIDGAIVSYNEEAVEKPAEKAEEELAAEAVEAEQAEEPETPARAIDRIPTNEAGEPVFENAPAADTWQAVLDMNEGDAAEAEDTARQMYEQAKVALDKVKKKKPKPGSTVMEIQANKAAAKKAVAEAQKKADYWKSVVDYRTEQAKRETERKEADRREPQSLTELVANAFARYKNGLDRDSFKKETGYGDADMNKFFQLWAKKGKGMTVYQMAEDIAANDESGLIPVDETGHKDIGAVVNAILEVFGGASRPSDLYQYTRNANMAREEEEKEYYEGLEEQRRMEQEAKEAEVPETAEAQEETPEITETEEIEETEVPEAAEEQEETEEQEEETETNEEPEETLEDIEEPEDSSEEEDDISTEIAAETSDTEQAPAEATEAKESESGADIDAQIEHLESIKTNPGADKKLVQAEIDRLKAEKEIAQAEQETEQNPTEGQKEAGNYKKGHIKIDGYDITVENPKGSFRRGTDQNGNAWETEMQNTYGYIRKTEGVDGDHIDVFLSDNPTEGDVYVIDQVNPKTGEFDEHKVMYGFKSEEEAKRAYLSNYEAGWKGLGNITAVSKEDFKKWVDSSHRKTKPFAEYKGVAKRATAKVKKSLQEKIAGWLTGENIEWAKGKGLKETIEHFGNTPEPIAVIPPVVRANVPSLESDYLYCGKAYLIDHRANHHQELGVEEYANIQTILDNYDDIKDLSEGGNLKLAFVKKLDKGYAVVAELSKEDNKIILHKTFFYRDGQRTPYKNKPSIFEKWSGDGSAPISPAINQQPADTESISALDTSSEGKDTNISKTSNNQEVKSSYEQREWSSDSDVDEMKAREVYLEKALSDGTKESAEAFPETEQFRKDTQSLLGLAREAKEKATAAFREKYKDYLSRVSRIHAELSNLRESIVRAEEKRHGDATKAERAKAAEGRKAKFNGFLEEMSPLSASAAEKALDKQYDFGDGKVMSVAQFVESHLAEGDLSAETKQSVSYPKSWNRMDDTEQKRWEETHRPKTEYIVNGQYLGKTAYDYAQYLLAQKASKTKGETKSGNKAESKAKSEPVEKIEDVGEKIGGAKKDLYKESMERIKRALERSDEDLMSFIASTPISKIFGFDFAKLREGGVSNEAISLIQIIKETLPAKPRTQWKLRRWVNDILVTYKTALTAMADWSKVEEVLKGKDLSSSALKERYDAYMAVGGFDSGLHLPKGTTLHRCRIGESMWSRDEGEVSLVGKWEVKTTAGFNNFEIYDTYEEAVEALKKLAGANAVSEKKEIKFSVYKRTSDGTFYITPSGKSDIVVADGFKSSEEAFKYVREHKAELQERYRTLLDVGKNEPGKNRERKGRDWRDGKDVSADEFRTAFGFRGVEFGNWMKQEDRKVALNECYDALMDLADVCGESPKALSLNGKLAMAFGARGNGKFNAHYEPGKVVINLTKTNGAGSLAHEWFHALDNYFARMGGTDAGGFATSKQGLGPGIQKHQFPSGKVMYYDTKTRKYVTKEEYDAAVAAHSVRKEMADAWEYLIETINKSAYGERSRSYAKLHNSKYWKEPTEMGARAFSVWVGNQLSKRNAVNDYLANDPELLEEAMDDDAKKYCPYPFNTDAEWMDEAFGGLFSAIEEKTDDETDNVVLFQTMSRALGIKTPEQQLAFDAVSQMLADAGVPVEEVSNEAMTQMAKRAEAQLQSKSKSAKAQWIDSYVEAMSLLSPSGKKRLRADLLRRIEKAKKEAKELYDNVLSGNFNSVTLQQINDYIDNATNRNRLFRPLSKRLPERALLSLSARGRASEVDALFSRICESAVPANGRAGAEARRRIEAKKEELLEGWAKATGFWHESIADFTSNTTPIKSGTDSDVYLSDSGNTVIKASKGKFGNKKFPTDIDQVPLFNAVFPRSAYRVLGYGRVNGKFVKYLEQEFVDFASSEPLSVDERVQYMHKLGFEPMNNEKTVFSNGEIVVSDLQKANIVKDAAGNVRVIDADVKLHTKDIGGNYSYPPVEEDTETTTENTPEFMTVYHGSGAKFDAFDSSHMGEGEGAQAYGWGHYVTEVEGIGRAYAKNPGGSVQYKGVRLSLTSRDVEISAASSILALQNRGNSFEEARAKFIESCDKLIAKTTNGSLKERLTAKREAAQGMKEEDFEETGHNLYTVEIPEDNGSNYLSYDADIPKKDVRRVLDALHSALAKDEENGYSDEAASKELRKELDSLADKEMTGNTLYGTVSSYLGSDKKASEFLSSLGYVGIKYPADYQNGGRKDKASNYVIFKDSDLKITDRIEFLRDGDVVYGAAVGGKIYLNAEHLNPNTPIHEYTHLWDKACKAKNPKLWKRGIELMKRTSLWKEVANDPNYQGLDEDGIASEVHSRLTGERGAELLERLSKEALEGKDVFDKAEKVSVVEGLRRWLSSFWHWVKDTMTPWSEEEAGMVSLEDFVNMPLADLAKGTRVSEIIAEVNASQKEAGKEYADPSDMETPEFSISKNNRRTIDSWLDKWEVANYGSKGKGSEHREAVDEWLDRIDNPTVQLAWTKWFCAGRIRLGQEDMPKVEQAVELARKVKVDPLSFDSPMAIIDQFKDRIKEKPIDPDTVPTLHRAKEFPEHGLVIYDVDDTQESRENMRRIINTHFGKDCSPWCLLQGDGEGNLTAQSERYWRHYNGYPKQVAFRNGKLLAFSANDTKERKWWDRMDLSHPGIPITGKVPNDELGRMGTVDIDAETGEEGRYYGFYKGNKQNGKYEIWYEFAGAERYVSTTYKDGKEDGLSEEYYRLPGKGWVLKNKKMYSAGRLYSTREFDHGKLDRSETYFEGFQFVENKSADKKTANLRMEEVSVSPRERVYQLSDIMLEKNWIWKDPAFSLQLGEGRFLTYDAGKYRMAVNGRAVALEESPEKLIAEFLEKHGFSGEPSVKGVEDYCRRRGEAILEESKKISDDFWAEHDNSDNDGVRFRTTEDGFTPEQLAAMETPMLKSKGTFKNLGEAEKWAKANLQGKTETNRFTGEEVNISGRSISEMLNPKSTQKVNEKVHLAALRSVLDFIRTGIPAEAHPDTHGRGYNVMRLYNAIEINGEIYRVKSTIKKLNIGDRFYTYEMQEMEIMSGTQSPAVGLDSTDGSRPQTHNSISGEELLKGVKKTNSDEYILDANVVNSSVNSNESGRYRGPVGGNSGYIGYSMSKRAAEARGEGRFPKGDFCKEYGVSRAHFDTLVKAGVIDNSEWHHTSSYGNRTEFYEWAEPEYREMYEEHKREIGQIISGSKNPYEKWLEEQKNLSAEAENALYEESKIHDFDKEAHYARLEEIEKDASEEDRPILEGLRKWEQFRNDHRGQEPAAEAVADMFEEELESKRREQEQAKVDAAQKLGEKLGVKVNVVSDAESISDNNKRRERRKRMSKGWYDTATGEIYVVVDNNADVADTEATILHEIVGHKGMREMVGDENYKDFLEKVYRAASPELRKKIAELALHRYGGDVNLATEEYIAGLAERGFKEREERDLLERIRDLFVDMFRRAKIALGVNLNDNDLRYMLWRAYKGRIKSALDLAEDISMQMEMQTGDFAESREVRFRDGEASEAYEKAERRVNDKGEKSIWANFWHRMREAYQDSMLALKSFQDAVSKETGNPIDDNENAYMAENAMSSKNKAQADIYRQKFYTPLLDAIRDLLKKGAEYEDIIAYAMAKHGLERNAYMARRKAAGDMAKRWDAFKAKYSGIDPATADKAVLGAMTAKRAKLEEREAQLVDKYSEEDFAGLKGLTGEPYDFTEKAKEMVRDFEDKYDTARLWDRVNAATKETLRRNYESGLMSRDAYNAVRGMFKYYIPLRGWDADVAADEYEYLRSGTPLFSQTLKTMRGRTSVADDPFATIGHMAESAIALGNRNLMKQKFLNFVLNNPTRLATVSRQWYALDQTTGEWEPRNPVIPEDADADTVASIVEQFEADMRDMQQKGLARNRKDGLNLSKHITVREGQEHVVRVKRNGQEYAIYINGNPRVAQAVNGLTNPNASDSRLVKYAQAIKNFMARMFTSQNPAFIVSNLARDLVWSGTAVAVKEDAAYNAQYQKNILANLGKGRLLSLVSKFGKGRLDESVPVEKYFSEFIRNGGETGFTQLNTVEDFKREMRRFAKDLRRSAAAKMPAQTWRAVWDGIEFMNRCAEDASRFSVYMTSRQMGRSVARSVYDAKEITVNFNKKGSGNYLGQLMNFAYIFFNAAVQSVANIAKIAGDHPARLTAAIGLYGVAGLLTPLASLAMCAAFGGGDDGDDGDDDYEAYWDLPEWTRRNNLVFYIPFSGKGFITIPLPHELRPFYGMGEIAFSVLCGKEDAEDGLRKAVEGFSSMVPLDFTGNGGNWFLNLTPTIAQPIAQIVANTDYFGVPIYKKNDYNKLDPDWTKAYKGTNAWVVNGTKWLNDVTGGDEGHKGVIDLNPAVIEHLYESYLGGVGKTVNRAFKTISMIWDKDMREWRNVPVASSFVQTANERTSGSQLNRIFYDYKDGEYDQVEHDFSRYKSFVKRGSTEYIDVLNDLVNSDEFKRYEKMRGYVRAIQKLNTELKNTDDDILREDIEATIKEVKRQAVEELRKEKESNR